MRLYELYIVSVMGTQIRPQNGRGLFFGYEKLREIDFNSSFDTSGTTDMSYLFCGCHQLAELDLSGFDTSHTVTMEGMFYWCSSLKLLDLRTFDTSHVTNMKRTV